MVSLMESLFLSGTIYVRLFKGRDRSFLWYGGLNKVPALTTGKEYYCMWFASFFFCLDAC